MSIQLANQVVTNSTGLSEPAFSKWLAMPIFLYSSPAALMKNREIPDAVRTSKEMSSVLKKENHGRAS